MNANWVAITAIAIRLTLAAMVGILLIVIVTGGQSDNGWREPPWFPPASPSATD